MKTLFALMMILTGALSATHAQAGSEGVGGGDDCENRIQEIGFDIKRWIQGGGSSDLVLPANISLDRYNQGMLSAISSSSVRCVGKGDAGYPVMIGNTPKVCRFERNAEGSTITCDYEKFKSLTDDEQYVLTHHEYAGVAQIENPNGEQSTYSVSNQISGYLVEKLVKKLAVKPKKGRSGAFTCQADIEKFIQKKFPKKKWTDGTTSKLIGVKIVESEYQGEYTGDVEIEAYAKFDLYYDEDGRGAERIFMVASSVLDDQMQVIGCKNFKVLASYEKWLAEAEDAR